MIGHLGARVSALLDGQLPPQEAERAWQHVQACHACRDLVEREGWIKTRLAGLSNDAGAAPDRLKGSLLGGTPMLSPESSYVTRPVAHRNRMSPGLVALGGGAVGAAVMGLVALGVAQGDLPSNERRAPVTQFVGPTPSPAAPSTLVDPRRPARTP